MLQILHVLPLLLLASLPACAPPAAPPAGSDSAATPPAAPDTSVVLALDPEGLRLVDAATGSARPLPFGTPEADVVRIVSAQTSQPAEASRNEECGAGPLAFATWPDGLQLAFQDGRFAGWSLGERASPSITTMAGVGIGASRADLDASVVTIVEGSTLGVEFESGGLYGLLSSDGPDGRVTALWAGVSCAFR